MGFWSNIGKSEKQDAPRINFCLPGIYTVELLSTFMGQSTGLKQGITMVKAKCKILEAKPFPGAADGDLHDVGSEVEWFTMLDNKFRWADSRAFVEAVHGIDMDALVAETGDDGKIITVDEQCEMFADLVFTDDGAAVAGSKFQVSVVESYSKKKEKMYYNSRFQAI